jgi:biotin carboxyl carrier protein
MELKSPSVGKVLRIEVEIDAIVERGATVIIIESMKVEIPIKAPQRGRVKELRVKPGDQIQRSHVLVVIEA